MWVRERKIEREKERWRERKKEMIRESEKEKNLGNLKKESARE